MAYVRCTHSLTLCVCVLCAVYIDMFVSVYSTQLKSDSSTFRWAPTATRQTITARANQRWRCIRQSACLIRWGQPNGNTFSTHSPTPALSLSRSLIMCLKWHFANALVFAPALDFDFALALTTVIYTRLCLCAVIYPNEPKEKRARTQNDKR